jgi:DHA1 family bicyclomycin/chloramphenicol resistance-like MFS transporter
MQTPPEAQPGRGVAPPLSLLAVVTVIGTASIHLFVPALPAAALDLGVGPGAIQSAISVYLLGIAVGQLAYGPLSDAFGRRPLLLVGLALYVIGSILASCAPNLATLLVARAIQAMGGCAGMALGRAIIRDTTQGDDTVRQLALLGTMALVSPGMGPMLGGAITAVAGWRPLFVLLTAAGLWAFYMTWRSLSETRPGARADRGRFTIRSVLADYRELLQHMPFVALVLGAGAITTSIYAFLSAAAFIVGGRLHQPVQMVGLVSGIVMFGILLGTALTAWLIRRVGEQPLLSVGAVGLVLSSGALVVLVQQDVLGLGMLIGLMLVFTSGIGLVHPILLGKALAMRPHLAGSASGLYGFSQMTLGAGSAALTGLGSDPGVSCMRVLCGASVLSCACVAYALMRERRLASRTA